MDQPILIKTKMFIPAVLDEQEMSEEEFKSKIDEYFKIANKTYFNCSVKYEKTKINGKTVAGYRIYGYYKNEKKQQRKVNSIESKRLNTVEDQLGLNLDNNIIRDNRDALVALIKDVVDGKI